MSESNYYKSDLRDLEFSLFEQFRLSELLATPRFEHISEDDAHMILKEAQTFATEVIGPTMTDTDREGCRLTEEGVKVPEVFKKVWAQYYEQGWNSLTLPDSLGGQGAPQMLGAAVLEMMSGANTAFHMYPSLTLGAAAVIAALGLPDQRELYVTNMLNGKWGGTMVLTESQAGSDVGMSTTKAVPDGDGRYKITGTKIFISGGDHDLAENIIHLTLARIEGAPKGTRGLSLFIVPKIRVNPDGTLGKANDVTCTHIEEKMGIHASATCALSFGENGECEGFLVGPPPADGGAETGGMQKMFLMMNGARIVVGIQALAVASTAYLNALEYARTRLQGAHPTRGRGDKGAVPIIEHPDVRRMLIEMKSEVESCRALLYFCQRLEDQASATRESDPEAADALMAYFDLLIPLIKSHISDVGVNVSSQALQVFGGAGYTGDFPAEQYLRDARIFPIYEGSNGIQAMDLVGRKLAGAGGAPIQRFIKEVTDFAAELKGNSAYAAEAGHLEAAVAGVGKIVGQYMQYFGGGKVEQILLTASPFLELMSRTFGAYLLLDGARIAEAALEKVDADSRDADFYRGKIASARYYARNILPPAVSLADVIASGDETPLEMPDAGWSLAY